MFVKLKKVSDKNDHYDNDFYGVKEGDILEVMMFFESGEVYVKTPSMRWLPLFTHEFEIVEA